MTGPPNYDVDRYKLAVDDIARTKDRQIQITYYSVVIIGALGGATKLASDLPERSDIVGGLIMAALVVNAIVVTAFHFTLDKALMKFRTRTRELGERLGWEHKTVAHKRARDLPLTYYFIAFPWGATAFALWYAWAMLFNV
jgi:hypothetical protein